jgi:hypothetical protein
MDKKLIKDKGLRLVAFGGAIFIVLLFVCSILSAASEISSLGAGGKTPAAKILNKVLNGTKIKRELTPIGGKILFTTVLLLLISLMLIFAFFAVPVSSNNDTFQANVTVGNTAPTVSGVNLNDSTPGTIQLTVSGSTSVKCNATLTDLNGYGDIAGANASIFYSANASNVADDVNYHYHNDTCTLFGGSGLTVYANCTVYLNYSAVNGTWNCNVTAWDNSTTNGTAVGSNTVDQLVALAIINQSIDFGSMTNGQNTTLVQARGINITNEGNVMIDLDVKALNSTMVCVIGSTDGCIGSIGVANMTFNLSAGTYDNMRNGYNLSTTNQTVSAFNLNPKGIDTADNVNASRNLYWGIQIPQAVKGEFNVNITVSAILG